MKKFKKLIWAKIDSSSAIRTGTHTKEKWKEESKADGAITCINPDKNIQDASLMIKSMVMGAITFSQELNTRELGVVA